MYWMLNQIATGPSHPGATDNPKWGQFVDTFDSSLLEVGRLLA